MSKAGCAEQRPGAGGAGKVKQAMVTAHRVLPSGDCSEGLASLWVHKMRRAEILMSPGKLER